jgi:hypothetical protein
LIGPFDSESHPVCGLRLRIGADLFDTESQAGKGLKSILLRKLRASFPTQGQQQTPVGTFTYSLPNVSDVSVRFLFNDSKTTLFIKVVLEDQTYVSATSELALRAIDGIPAFAPIRKVDVDFGGPSIDRIKNEAIAFGALGGSDGVAQIFCFADSALGLGNCKGTAQKIANQRLPVAIQTAVKQTLNDQFSRLNTQLSALKRPLAPFANRPDAALQLRLATDPTFDKNGLDLSICSSLSLSTKLFPQVPGPVQAFSNLTAPATLPPTSNSVISLALNANQLNQLLYFLWQSGALKELGATPSLIDALPSQSKDLAFTVTGFEPQLPPTVSTLPPKNSGLMVSFGDVRIGNWQGHSVTSHAIAELSAHSEADQIAFSATFPTVAINCVDAPRGGHTKLSSCFSDLLPAVTETLRQDPMVRKLSGGDVLSALPRLFFEGLRLELSGLSVESRSQSRTLEATVQARIVEQN